MNDDLKRELIYVITFVFIVFSVMFLAMKHVKADEECHIFTFGDTVMTCCTYDNVTTCI